MDATTSFILSGMAGVPVDLVLYEEGRTRLIKTEIEQPLPLRLKLVEKNRDGLRAGRRVMLLTHAEGVAMRADGHLDQIARDEEGVHLAISQVHWELLERRRHVRIPLYVPVTLRTVVEDGETTEVACFEGYTVDMSISGAFVKMSPTPASGSLVEFSMDLEGEPVRTLAVVAHGGDDRGGVGLHFVEYVGNARFLIQGYLSRAA